MGEITVGILAHVDSGKTTLSESILYLNGAIRKAGRVDNQDAFLDHYELERSRGITIFSKQARVTLGDTQVTLLDTPGHVDFSAEMERTLWVLDYAILVLSGADGVQGHTETLWKLLKRYKIPTFLFINKMDQPGTNQEALLAEIKHRLDENCLDFSNKEDENFLENLAMCDEHALEHFLETNQVEERSITTMIQKREVFPCYFGSALHMTGLETFFADLKTYMKPPSYPDAFGAKVNKIARDEQNNRLTYLKVTGGSLHVKDTIDNEKINQIRLYSGAKYETTEEVKAGSVCAVTGLATTYPGQGLGAQGDSDVPVLQPVLNYRIVLPPDVDAHMALLQLKQLEEEEPELHIEWAKQTGEIHAQLMGEIQTEILQSIIYERFGILVNFEEGRIIYRETIASPVEGVGHFEPLRHYAEVHLLLEPGDAGSGLHFATNVSEDVLDKNWQRLILTHLEEQEHPGVLTGSPITDMKITLVGGKAHLKHTEGGDFRQATYRAVRQGLKMAESILLEPYYEFRLEVPQDMIGRAMADIQRMNGSFEMEHQDEMSGILVGTAPVSAMRGYQREVNSYSGGRGRLSCIWKGYEPCQNQDAVIDEIRYDSERDLEHPTGSVFCAHGAGFVVPWNEVRDHMHIDTGILNDVKVPEIQEPQIPFEARQREYQVTENELEEIFARTYGQKKDQEQITKKWVRAKATPDKPYKAKEKKHKDEYLLVDGYNIIFAWEELNALAQENLHGACTKLMDILSNYQGYKKCVLILVFDAYKVEGHPEEVFTYHNIHVVYTREAETADQYIERTVHNMNREYQVTVATSDRLEQIIILGQGAQRISALGLQKEIEESMAQQRKEWEEQKETHKQYLFDGASEELADYVEEVRLGKIDPTDLQENK